MSEKPFCPHCKKLDALHPPCIIPGHSWFCVHCGESVSEERTFRIIDFMKREKNKKEVKK